MEGSPGGRDRPGQVRKDLKNHCKSWGFIWKAMEVEKGFGALSRNSQICTLGSPLWLHLVGAGGWGGGGWKERDQRGTGQGLGGGDCKGDRHWRHAAGRSDKGVRARGRKKERLVGQWQGRMGGPSLGYWSSPHNQRPPGWGRRFHDWQRSQATPSPKRAPEGDFWNGKEAGKLSWSCLQAARSPLPVWPGLTHAY